MAELGLLASLRARVRHGNEAPAFVGEAGSLTYAQLASWSSSLARELAVNAPRGRPVLLFGHKHPEMLAAILACVRAGLPYVPADESVPDERAFTMARIAGCGIILNTGGSRDLPSREGAAPVFPYSRVAEWCRAGGEDFGWPAEGAAGDCLYVLFTSGSTGEPKGVQVSIGNVESFVRWTTAECAYSEPGTGFLNQAPFHFDLSVFELYNALVSGGCLFSLSRSAISDMPRMLETLGSWRERLHVWVSTPSFLDFCASAEAFGPALLPRLRQIVVDGEVLSPALARRLLAKFPEARLWNFYGPTEATVAHTAQEVLAADVAGESPIPVGRAKPGGVVRIESGEIILGGDNVAMGYVNDPARTAEKFFERDGIRYYRTGDHGRIDEAGLLHFEGRIDDQVKIRGYRVEPGEIEARLRELPEIAACCVLPATEGGRVDYLAAFLVLREGSAMAGAEGEFRRRLNARLGTTLPPYMLPKRYVRLGALPLTPNGKLDRAALRRLL